MEVLQVDNLSKHYGLIKALDGLSFSVSEGQVMGILGPNGSGKTTTLGIILGVLNQNSGSYTWFENKYGDKHRLQIGAILETPNFYPYLNAEQNLDIVRQIKRVDNKNFDSLLDLVQLSERKKSPFRSYSLGMKQRLAIAATLIGDPKIVIFDEPTNGLDPQGIAEVRSVLKDIASRGRTVIMASHILDEVEKICSHVTMLKNGKILSSGPVGSILSDNVTLEIGAENRDTLVKFLETYPGIISVKLTGNHLECKADESILIAELNKKAISSDIKINHLIARKSRLEEEFLEIVKGHKSN